MVTMDFIFFARSMRSWDRRVDGDVGMSTPAARVGWSGERTLVGRMDESSSETRRRGDDAGDVEAGRCVYSTVDRFARSSFARAFAASMRVS